MPRVEIAFDETDAIPHCFNPNENFFKDWVAVIKNGEVIGLLNKKLLEPRYTAAELEKIMKTTLLTLNKSREPFVISDFIKFLKDKKKVQEILDA